MLVIRRPQLSRLQEAMTAQTRVDLQAHLRDRFSRMTAPLADDALDALIDDGIARAGQYGLDDRFGAAVFVELMLAFSPDFDQVDAHSWARDILGDVRCPAWFKRERLIAQAKAKGHDDAPFGSFPGMPRSHQLGP